MRQIEPLCRLKPVPQRNGTVYSGINEWHLEGHQNAKFIGVENHHPTHVLRKGKTVVPGFLVEVAVWTACLQDPHGVLASIDTNSAAHLLEAETLLSASLSVRSNAAGSQSCGHSCTTVRTYF